MSGREMARLFISDKREKQDDAFALRQWLIDAQGWADMIVREAESAEAMLFLASEASPQPERDSSFK